MVSESGARALWRDQDPLGQTWTDRRTGRSRVVVGIVRDSGLSVLRGGAGEAYVPLSDERLARVVLLVHTTGDPQGLLRDARAAAAPVGLVPTATMMEATLNLPRPSGAGPGLIVVLGLLATLLAFTGIFGLVAFAVAQRTREIGVRVALGARRIDVLTTLLAQYAMPVGAGSVGASSSLSPDRKRCGGSCTDCPGSMPSATQQELPVSPPPRSWP